MNNLETGPKVDDQLFENEVNDEDIANIKIQSNTEKVTSLEDTKKTIANMNSIYNEIYMNLFHKGKKDKTNLYTYQIDDSDGKYIINMISNDGGNNYKIEQKNGKTIINGLDENMKEEISNEEAMIILEDMRKDLSMKGRAEEQDNKSHKELKEFLKNEEQYKPLLDFYNLFDKNGKGDEFVSILLKKGITKDNCNFNYDKSSYLRILEYEEPLQIKRIYSINPYMEIKVPNTDNKGNQFETFKLFYKKFNEINNTIK